jgi:hypothetical protein
MASQGFFGAFSEVETTVLRHFVLDQVLVVAHVQVDFAVIGASLAPVANE